MADWKTRRAFYKSSQSLGTQSFEDMLARRVIRGLGYPSAKDIVKAENAVLGVVKNDAPLWHRAREVYKHCAARCDNAHMLSNMLLDAIEVKNNEEALDRVAAIDTEAHNVKPLLFTRIHRTNNCYAYTFWAVEDLVLLSPPYLVLPNEGTSPLLFTRQELTHFVNQFAPYYNINISEK